VKRSEINSYIDDAIALFDKIKWRLPPFAFWSYQKWREIMKDSVLKEKYHNIVEGGLGWDITDFGSRDFEKVGLVLFSMRNGILNTSRDYAEKIMIVREKQATPWHYHWLKTEDIINRSGGNLVIELFHALKKEEIDSTMAWKVGVYDIDTPIEFLKDGSLEIVEPGTKVILNPGESITLTPYLYHTFYGQKGTGKVIVGEISKVNDDAADNRFFDKLPRFSEIEEDEDIRYVLVNEYNNISL
jgi:D-lyxose ketol-isomerase